MGSEIMLVVDRGFYQLTNLCVLSLDGQAGTHLLLYN